MPGNAILKFCKWWVWLGATPKVPPKMGLFNMGGADFVPMPVDAGVFTEWKNPT